MSQPELRPSVPLLRLFKARAKSGCEAALAKKLATTSAQLGSGLIDHSQKMTIAAIQIADMNV